MKRNDAERSFLTFSIQGQVFALDLDYMQEVLDPVHVSPLPFVPEFVKGLVNINSQIMPLVCGSQLCEAALNDESNVSAVGGNLLNKTITTNIILKFQNLSFAFEAGEILQSLSLHTDSITEELEVENIEGFFYINEHFQAADSGTKVFIFTPEKLYKEIAEHAQEDADTLEQGFLGELKPNVDSEEASSEYLLVRASDQEYAIRLNEIREVIDLENISPVISAPSYVLGITLLRNNPLLAIDINQLFGLNALKRHQANHTLASVVVYHEHYYFAICFDEIYHLEKIADENITEDSHQQKTVTQAADGKLYEILDLQNIFSQQRFEDLSHFLPKVNMAEQEHIKTLDVLKFNLNQQTYGVLIDDVDRIVNGFKIDLNLTPYKNIAGNCEFDGHVIPVINLPSQLCHQAQETNNNPHSFIEECKEAIIVNFKQQFWALGIDGSETIIKVEEKRIEFLPDADFPIKAYANDNNELMHIINVEHICSDNL